MSKKTESQSVPNPVTKPVTQPPQPQEIFFRMKVMPASLVQYSVEQITIEGDIVVERKIATERDILPVTFSKLEDLILREIRR